MRRGDGKGRSLDHSPLGRGGRSLALLDSSATSIAASGSCSSGFSGRRTSAALLHFALDFLILGALGAMFLESVLKVLQVRLGPIQLVGRCTDLYGGSLEIVNKRLGFTRATQIADSPWSRSRRNACTPFLHEACPDRMADLPYRRERESALRIVRDAQRQRTTHPLGAS